MIVRFKTKNPCLWVWQDVGTMFFGWRLAGYDCELLDNGRYANSVRLDRGNPYFVVRDATQPIPKRPHKVRVYQRTKLRVAIRLLWLVLRKGVKHDALPTSL